MSFVFLLLLYFDLNCRLEIFELYKLPKFSEPDIIGSEFFTWALILLSFTGYAIFGMALSFFHILKRGNKGDFSESSMKFFALIISGIIGVKSGMHVIENQNYMFYISPAWNILNGIFIFYFIGFHDEVPFDQSDASFLQVILSVIAVSILFYFLHFVFQIYWALVFSISINYALCLNRGLLKTPNLLKANILEP